MVYGIIIIVIFLILAGLMITKKMPALLALPVMAVSIGVVSGVAAGLPWTVSHFWPLGSAYELIAALAAGAPWSAAAKPTLGLRDFLFTTILTKGSVMLADAMLFAAFGAILSQVVMRQGIAQRIVRVAAEFAGDRKILLALLMTAAVTLSFTSLVGLGAVIMVGSLALPIMIGAGLSPSYSACLLLFSICLGGVFNGANWGFYTSMLKVDLAVVRLFAGVNGLLLALTAFAFIVLEGRREKNRFTWALRDDEPARSVPWPSLLTPLVPILLLMLPWTRWPIIPAFLAAILYGCLTTEPRRTIPNLTAATLEGLKDFSPVIGLFIGIGMTVASLKDPVTSAIMDPFIHAVTPSSPAAYLLVFTLLAPLSLYRGPLNLYGLGAGFATLLLASNLLTPPAVMAAFLAVGQVQGICDPTNTHNVWIAQFSKLSADELMKRTLPYVWLFVLLALLYAVFIGRVV